MHPPTDSSANRAAAQSACESRRPEQIMALGATGILKSALLLSNVGYVDRLASSGGPADCPKANGDGDEGILDDSEHEKGKA